jgi:hypothetical protein
MGLLPLLPVVCAAASMRKEEREKKRRKGRGREKEKEIKNGNILQIRNIFHKEN